MDSQADDQRSCLAYKVVPSGKVQGGSLIVTARCEASVQGCPIPQF